MTDLLPLIVFVIGLAWSVLGILTLRSKAAVHQVSRKDLNWPMGAIVLLSMPYLMFARLNGDPDVWDFYRLVGFVPLVAVLLVVAAMVTIVLRGAKKHAH